MGSSNVDQGQLLDTLDVALYAFALVPPVAGETNTAELYRDLMFNRTTREGLRRSADREAIFAAQRLRVALELAPVEAITYLDANPVARWKLIYQHLMSSYSDVSPDLLTQLARRIAVILTDWQEPRASASVNRRAVWIKSLGRCCACHYDFEARSSPALTSEDPFKPYYWSPDELTAEEIDHIVAISGVGTNELDNLQLLCRWCNFGKGDGLGVDIRREAEFATTAVDLIPRIHVAAMAYMTLADNDFRCELCGSVGELTTRLRNLRHGYLLSNLVSICYECIDHLGDGDTLTGMGGWNRGRESGDSVR